MAAYAFGIDVDLTDGNQSNSAPAPKMDIHSDNHGQKSYAEYTTPTPPSDVLLQKKRQPLCLVATSGMNQPILPSFTPDLLYSRELDGTHLLLSSPDESSCLDVTDAVNGDET